MDYDELFDLAEDIEDLIEEHKDFSSSELVERADEYDSKILDIINEIKDGLRELEEEFDRSSRRESNLESQISDYEEKIDTLEGDIKKDNLNLYDLQKFRITTDLYKNMTLAELEELENFAVQTKKNKSDAYLASSLSEL